MTYLLYSWLIEIQDSKMYLEVYTTSQNYVDTQMHHINVIFGIPAGISCLYTFMKFASHDHKSKQKDV